MVGSWLRSVICMSNLDMRNECRPHWWYTIQHMSSWMVGSWLRRVICMRNPDTTNQRRRRLGLKQLRLPKFATSFHRSPRTYQTHFLGSPQNFKQGFTLVIGVPVTAKERWENRRILRSWYFKSDLLHERWVSDIMLISNPTHGFTNDWFVNETSFACTT